MFTHNLNPVLIWVKGFPITYYWLVYLVGFILSFFLLHHARKKGEIEITKKDAYILTLLAIIGLIIGARLFHAAFWYWDYYASDPTRLLFIWQGGMSFHGGLVGALIPTLIYCYKRKIKFYKIADLFAFLGVIMPALTRICNFINQEIVGIITNVKWCFKFKYHEGCRHPVQLYASAGRLAFFALITYWKKKFKDFQDGFIFWLFIFGIGLGRFILDFWRQDAIFYSLKAGQ